jgi:hypothetical protein
MGVKIFISNVFTDVSVESSKLNFSSWDQLDSYPKSNLIEIQLKLTEVLDCSILRVDYFVPSWYLFFRIVLAGLSLNMC